MVGGTRINGRRICRPHIHTSMAMGVDDGTMSVPHDMAGSPVLVPRSGFCARGRRAKGESGQKDGDEVFHCFDQM